MEIPVCGPDWLRHSGPHLFRSAQREGYGEAEISRGLLGKGKSLRKEAEVTPPRHSGSGSSSSGAFGYCGPVARELRVGRRRPGRAEWNLVSREVGAARGRSAESPALLSYLRSGREPRALRAVAGRERDPRVPRRPRRAAAPPSAEEVGGGRRKELLEGRLNGARVSVLSATAAWVRRARFKSRACPPRPPAGESLLKCLLGDPKFDLKPLCLWRVCGGLAFLLTR